MASSAVATVAANPFSATWVSETLWGVANVLGEGRRLRDIPAIPLLNGTAVGQINRIGIFSGTLTNVTPGTTDTVLIDLKNLTNLDGVAFTDLTKVIGMLLLNDEATAGRTLVYGAAAANAFDDIFDGLATGKAKINPGHTDAGDGIVRPGYDMKIAASLAGYTVDATHKIIKLYSGSAASLAYRGVILGRTA